MQKTIAVTVFISGMVSLAVEMAASRLLGNYFGASNLIWATIIGLILIYLTAGYYLGGAWADKSPRPATFYQILAWAGFTIGLIPLVSRPILRAAANAFDGLQLGAMIGAQAERRRGMYWYQGRCYQRVAGGYQPIPRRYCH